MAAMLRLHVHPQNPQTRHIARAVDMLRSGAVGIYPTDTTYGLGCDIFAKRSIERIYQLKGMSSKHPLSFLCSDLSEVARYAIIENAIYRTLKHHMPGNITFILPATREVPKLLQGNARTVGIRIPNDPVCLALTRELGHPIISTTVSRAPQEEHHYLSEPDEIAAQFGRSVEFFLDSGSLTGEPSSVVDLSSDGPQVLRQGSGDISFFMPRA